MMSMHGKPSNLSESKVIPFELPVSKEVLLTEKVKQEIWERMKEVLHATPHAGALSVIHSVIFFEGSVPKPDVD